MSKGNSTSIRYSDDVVNIINQYEGNTFSEKFHNLVLDCFNKIDYIKRRKALIDGIDYYKNEFSSYIDKINKLRLLESDFCNKNDVISRSLNHIINI